MGQLADWKCHKVVKAGKIIERHDGVFKVEDINGTVCAVHMPESAFARGYPQDGDYIVIYEDGYKSWSPAKAFEEGYTKQDA